MVNYKKTEGFIVAGIKVPVPQNAQLRFLTEQTQASGVADAMYWKSAVYQVPATQRFRCRGVKVWLDGTGGGSLLIYTAATEDATTGLLATIDLPFITNGNMYEESVDFNIAASQFITIVPSGTTVLHTVLIGFQEQV